MDVKEIATTIVRKLAEAGYIAYFAGGWVRDYIMDHPSSDIDIATDASPEKILEIFPKTIQVGISFGVVIVVEEGHQFEISTFRQDLGYEDGRRPKEIALSTPEEDAKRRDFTINGMFYDPLKDLILDYVGGQEDIRRGVIRTIGNPDERFVEDRLRMIRAIRFASRFKFEIDPATRSAIIENADTLFPPVAIERVWQEIKKMVEYPRFEEAIFELRQTGLLSVIFPGLQHVSLDRIKKWTIPFQYFPKDCPAILYVMELFSDLTTGAQLEICQYLKVSNENQKLVEYVHRGKQMILRDEPISDINWVYFYAHTHSTLCLEVIAARFNEEERRTFLEEQKKNRERLHSHIERKIHNSPLITSDDLRENDIQPGKVMGDLLREAEHLAIEKNINEPNQVIDLLRKSEIWPS